MDEKANKTLNIDSNIPPIFYTDSVFIVANEDGLIFDILQRIGNTNQAKVVSRIGMSRSHAKKFAAELGKLLAITEGHAKTERGGN